MADSNTLEIRKVKDVHVVLLKKGNVMAVTGMIHQQLDGGHFVEVLGVSSTFATHAECVAWLHGFVDALTQDEEEHFP